MKIQGYDLLQPIYKSATTTVYRALRQADGRPVVLKLPTDVHPPAPVVEKYRREYELLRRLNTPGVIKAYALDLQGARPVLVLEETDGQSLQELMSATTLDLEDILRLAADVARVLGEIHKQGVIHKDLTPANLLVNREEGRVTLIDFGIATQRAHPQGRVHEVAQGALGTSYFQEPEAEGKRSDEAPLLEGTLAYLSPEQTGRIDRPVNHRTDFYSFGAVLYEWLTGQPVFRSDDPLELVHAHLAKTPRPPHEVRPEIPQPLSDLVMKCLAKSAEDRYHSAYGLLADLEHCLHHWQHYGEIPAFPLAMRDRAAELEMPAHLYGREEQEAHLAAAYQRVEQGARELLLVSGPAGIGKTAFVRQLQGIVHRSRLLKQAEGGARTPEASGGALLVGGKFEQLRRDIPYAPFLQAAQAMVRHLLRQSDAEVTRWKTNLLQAVKGNGQLLIDIFPVLEKLIGPQPPVPDLPPQEMQNRFRHVMRTFLKQFAQPEHPVILLLDDLQWADAASLEWLELIFNGDDLHHLLIVGTYREEEVDVVHPLSATLRAIREEGGRVEQIALRPLQREELATMLSDTLRMPTDQTDGLAQLLLSRTEGNPFFIKQLLHALVDSGGLTYDPSQARWCWETTTPQRLKLPDTLADLLVTRLQRLPDDCLQALKLAACLGNTFELHTLANLLGHSLSLTWHALQPALQEGLLEVSEAIAGTPSRGERAEADAEVPDTLSFQHDRLQEAAYRLLDAKERQDLHLCIARLLCDRRPEDGQDFLFEIANQYNAALSHITDTSERLAAARLFRQAGRKAKAASAYEQALTYLRAGDSLLQTDGWYLARQLMIDLQLERVEAEYLCGHLEAAEKLFADLHTQAQTVLEKVAVFRRQMVFYTQLFRYEEVIHLARQALRLLGVSIPLKPGKRAIAGQMLAARLRIGKRTADDLFRLPQMQDPLMKEALLLLTNTNAAAYFVDHDLWAWVVLKVLNLSLRYGNSAESSFGYGGYGMILGALFHDYDNAYRLGEMACRLSEEYADPTYVCRSYYSFGSLAVHWREHVAVSIAQLKKAYRLGVENGDFSYACYAVGAVVSHLLFAGAPFAEIEQEIVEHTAFVDEIHFSMVSNSFALCRSLLRFLREEGGAAAWERPDLLADETGITDFLWHLYRMQGLYLFGRHEEALSEAQEAEARLQAVVSQIHQTEHAFTYALILTSLATEAEAAGDPARKRGYLRRVRPLQRRLQRWAASCPANNTSKLRLVEAELARLQGRDALAMTRYEEAMQAARDNGFLHQEALIAERAADFYLAHRNPRTAALYLRLAEKAYLRWGATAKAKQVAERHAALVPDAHSHKHPHDPFARTYDAEMRDRSDWPTHSYSGTSSHLLDLLSVVKASQAISGEIVLPHLLAQLMQVLLQNAGAERGCLLLEEAGVWQVMASGEVDKPVEYPMQRAEAYPALCHAIVQFAARSGEAVVLADAARQSPFADDPYIRQTQAKSILCLPVSHQAKQSALLYLENNLTAAAFTPEQVEVLHLLAGQFAISLENARLYASLEQSRDQLAVALEQVEEHSLTLEGKVAARTADLEKTNAHLRRTMRENANALAEIAVLEERNRIAHDIHDSVGHTLTATIVQLEAGMRLLDRQPAAAFAKFELSQELVGKGLQEIRRAVRMMREENNALDLAPALANLIQETERYAGVTIEFDIHPMPDQLLSSQKKVLFRALQEGLTNGIRHGGSTAFTFELSVEEERIHFKLQDNGRGDQASQPKPGFGLTAMRERVESLGGELRLTCEQGSGCLLQIRLPITQQAT
ncbi:MAG TPA: AAA family ATPase [Bacilli bacterium]|nr:AAA family ATPase [Bacilli bacterium]